MIDIANMLADHEDPDFGDLPEMPSQGGNNAQPDVGNSPASGPEVILRSFNARMSKIPEKMSVDMSQSGSPTAPQNVQGVLGMLGESMPDPQSTDHIVRQTVLLRPLKMDGLITRGDEPLQMDAPPKMEEKIEDRLLAHGFPPRPAQWPAFIDWPPREIAEKFLDERMTDEKRQRVVAMLLKMEEASLRRAQQINDWLYQVNPAKQPGFTEHDSEARAMRRNLRIIQKAQSDPHHSIRWATLINPMAQSQSALSSVVTWSQTSATTLDGGRVLVDKDSISFSGGSQATMPYTPQAIMLGIQEAKNRGWKTLKMSGSYEFAQMAIKAAREAGIEAEITFYGKGIGSWTKHTVKVTPNLPMVDEDITKMMNSAIGDPVSDRLGVKPDEEKKVPTSDQKISAFASKREPSAPAVQAAQEGQSDRSGTARSQDPQADDSRESPPLESYEQIGYSQP